MFSKDNIQSVLDVLCLGLERSKLDLRASLIQGRLYSSFCAGCVKLQQQLSINKKFLVYFLAALQLFAPATTIVLHSFPRSSLHTCPLSPCMAVSDTFLVHRRRYNKHVSGNRNTQSILLQHFESSV